MRWGYSKPNMARMLPSTNGPVQRFLSAVKQKAPADRLDDTALSTFVQRYLVPVLTHRNDTKKAYKAYCTHFGVTPTAKDADAALVVKFFDGGCDGDCKRYMALGIFYRCIVSGVKILPLRPVVFDQQMRPDGVDVEQWRSNVIDKLDPVERDKLRLWIVGCLSKPVTQSESTYSLSVKAAKKMKNDQLFEHLCQLHGIDVRSAWDCMKWTPDTLAKYANLCFLSFDDSQCVEVSESL